MVALLATHWPQAARGLVTRSSAVPTVLASSEDAFVPQFSSPQLTRTQFLFVSSPRERKIVYTQLKNFKSLTGRTFALVDSGLLEPAGLAFDHRRGFLYVADRVASKIYRYRVLVQETKILGTTSLSLVTDGVQLCIMQGHPVEWVSVDQFGDVFYSNAGANTINRIPVDVIDMMVEGAYHCGDISILSENEQVAQANELADKEQSLSEAETAALMPTDAPNTQPIALAMYEGNSTTHVSSPGGIVSDGQRVYWTNMVGGLKSGAVSAGEVHPEPPLASGTTSGDPFPTAVLTNIADAAYGITRSNTMVFFSTNQSGTGSVYAVADDGRSHAIVSSLLQPRGLVWDGDNTVYVADEAGSKVFSFPVGRPMDDAPLTQSVVLTGAFGLALLSQGDPAFQNRANGA